jgi:hypothetical protein
MNYDLIMKKFFITLVFIFPLLHKTAYSNTQLSVDSINVYLLTASPGEETYAAFGHSAIRIYIPSKGINTVYNYGTFNFQTHNFYLKFSSGRLMYFLSQIDYMDFINAYHSWGQAIYEQKILLTPQQSVRLVQLIDENYREENRYYRYGFFYDNCATRIRDIIEKATDQKIVYDSTYVSKKESFRQLMGNYLGKTPWIYFGINILLGTGTDSIATLRDYMFLPEHLKNLYSRSYIQTGYSLRHLTGPPVELFPATLVFPKNNPILSPVCITGILLLLISLLTWLEIKRKWNFKWFDRILFFITGLLGMLLTVLWIWSLHHELENNFNVLWANPINLFICFLLLFKTKPTWFKYLVGVYAISLICFIPISVFITQSLPGAAYFIAGIMIVRSWAIILKQTK